MDNSVHILYDLKNLFKGGCVDFIVASLFVEASVVGIVCIIFLLLFVVAGIRQILKDRNE